MKLEIGMYVRLSHYGFDKIKNIYNKPNDILILEFEKLNVRLSNTNVLLQMASHDIKDLITIKDYVNGCKVGIVQGWNYSFEKVLISQDGFCKFKDITIDSAVTKEQFNIMEFEVK